MNIYDGSDNTGITIGKYKTYHLDYKDIESVEWNEEDYTVTIVTKDGRTIEVDSTWNNQANLWRNPDEYYDEYEDCNMISGFEYESDGKFVDELKSHLGKEN